MINLCPVKFYGRFLGFYVTIIRVLGENVKDRLNCRRTLVSSDESLEGKLFVEFIPKLPEKGYQIHNCQVLFFLL